MRTISDGFVANKAPISTPSEEEDADGVEAGRRLVRIDGGRGISLAERVAAHLRLLAWKSPLHKLRLRGRFPLKLITVPTDPIEGDATRGTALLSGGFSYMGTRIPLKGFSFLGIRGAPAVRDWLHSFAWLRDLAAAAPRETAAMVAEPLTRVWLHEYDEFDPIGWRPDLIGSRILFWTAYAPMICKGADLVYWSSVLNALARMARHLERSAAKTEDGLPRITAFAGLVASGLMLPGGEQRQMLGQAGLERALAQFVHDDGGIASRCPAEALELLELLLMTRACYSSRRMLPPPWFDSTIDRMVPALKGVTMGDGALSAWHGGGPANAQRLERAISASGIMARPQKRGDDWGFQRLAGGKTVLVCDVGPPPAARLAGSGHASTLAFELSDGAQRIVVNCGGGRGASTALDGEIALLLKSTAAHSTLIIADVNSTAIRSDGALGRGVGEVLVHRQENEGGTWVDAEHDGYVRRFGVRHTRRLYMAANGVDLRGEDILVPAQTRNARRRNEPLRFDVRFHLAPGVEAVPTADGQAALIKLPGGRVWQFRCRGGALTFDDSIWVDGSGTIRPTRQMVVSGEAPPGGGSVAWSFRRAG